MKPEQIKQIIDESKTVEEAVNRLLSEDQEFSAGDVVVSVNDNESWPYQGVAGRVKGPSTKGSGWVDVTYADSVTVPIQSNLLLRQ
jgi:hypothetical protein